MYVQGIFQTFRGREGGRKGTGFEWTAKRFIVHTVLWAYLVVVVPVALFVSNVISIL